MDLARLSEAVRARTLHTEQPTLMMPTQRLSGLIETSLRRLRSAALLAGVVLTGSAAFGQNLKGDEALVKVLVDGEGWQVMAQGYKFTDAACSDAEGNFFFADVSAGSSINRIDPTGKVSELITNTPRISGLKLGPDGRIYACTQSPKKQVVAFTLPEGTMTVLADDVQPNDLVVSRRGNVYFTETGKGQVTLIDTNGHMRAVATGISSPNGIGLSPDHGSLAVSEYTGLSVWVYRINADGTLSAGDRYMELRAPQGTIRSEGDGMAVDSDGRYYVTSALGIQMFDWTGRLGGVIARPQAKGTVSVALAGPDLSYLYACSSDKVYRRKLKVKGGPNPLSGVR